MKTSWENIAVCRVCKHEDLKEVHDFGHVPLADKLTDQPGDDVPSADLSVVFCRHCHHLQIRENVDPEMLFKFEYPYYSSKIPEVVRHFETTYRSIVGKMEISPSDHVAEIASNDGTLIRHFEAQTPNLICIEPSLDHAKITEKMGYTTYPVFFGSAMAGKIREETGTGMRLIMANNVLAHVPDPYDFALGVSRLLADNGRAVIEVPHTFNMIANCTFDVIFHQHYSYFNLHTLRYLFGSVGLHIQTIEKIPTQGGTLRLFIGKEETIDASVGLILEEEKQAGILNTATYERFSRRIDKSREELRSFIDIHRAEGRSIVGYGAPGKAATLLNYFGIDDRQFDYLVDISDNKHYKFFPFTGLEILPVEQLRDDLPDFIVILAWNYAESIVESLKDLKSHGCRFVVPHPELRFI